MLKRICVDRPGIKAAKFKSEKDKVRRVSENSDEMASTWIVDVGVDEDVGEYRKRNEDLKETETLLGKDVVEYRNVDGKAEWEGEWDHIHAVTHGWRCGGHWEWDGG